MSNRTLSDCFRTRLAWCGVCSSKECSESEESEEEDHDWRFGLKAKINLLAFYFIANCKIYQNTNRYK